MKALLLSAYDAASHACWRKGLVAQFPEIDWTVLTLPARYFSWRLRGNSLSWAFNERELLEQPYDLLIVTSMTDLSALRGFVPSLVQIPTWVYFHENQFAYPESGQEYGVVEPKILNIYTALAADFVCFNTEFNRNTFLEGCRKLLKKLPDHVPAGLPQRLEQISSVLPVPLSAEVFLPAMEQADSVQPDSLQVTWSEQCKSHCIDRPLLIVWAARWEYDKGPDRLLAIMRELESRGADYRMCILGERFRNTPKEFDAIKLEFEHRIDQFGFAESKEEYLQWLSCADIVLSTATHEFQGLSVLEAVARGCIPVLPNRQVYPELFESEYIYDDCGDDLETEAKAAADTIVLHAQLLRENKARVPAVDHFGWSEMKAEYAVIIERVIDSHSK